MKLKLREMPQAELDIFGAAVSGMRDADMALTAAVIKWEIGDQHGEAEENEILRLVQNRKDARNHYAHVLRELRRRQRGRQNSGNSNKASVE